MRCLTCGWRLCDCGRPATAKPKPEVGQWIRIVQKFKDGLTATWEGCVTEVLWGDDDTRVRAVHIGVHRFALECQPHAMTEPVSWEIISPPEPPNLAIWICRDVNGSGKPAAWRRIDAMAYATYSRWLAPGADQGLTWKQVSDAGPGYLLESRDD